MQPAAPAIAVIDTNVVLDWLVFGNPDVSELASHITSGRLRWLSTGAMRDELERVLTRDTLQRWQSQSERVLRTWDEWSDPVPTPAHIAAHGVHCTDCDDQKFIDLAIGMRSSWLFTRDRSLLSLAQRARRFGVEVLTPRAWRTAIAARA
jgi:putative PIN family toxin of toxin-antitoxin system